VRLSISKVGKLFLVDDTSRCGSPPCGRGRTMFEAIGNYFHSNQRDLAIEFVVEKSARPAETRRRRRELAKR
jgi:hypothetical protein